MTDEDQKYREIREQGRQDGILDGRRGYALVRPVEGVTLTPEEADLACTALRKVPWREQSNLDRSWALAARLEGC